MLHTALLNSRKSGVRTLCGGQHEFLPTALITVDHVEDHHDLGVREVPHPRTDSLLNVPEEDAFRLWVKVELCVLADDIPSFRTFCRGGRLIKS